MALVVRDLRVKDFKGQERDYKLFFNMTEPGLGVLYTVLLSVKLTKGKTLLKGQRVKVIFRGRTYIAKTNYKGIARVTIKRAVIKKLKAGKKYAVKFTYSKYSIKRVVKVRH